MYTYKLYFCMESEKHWSTAKLNFQRERERQGKRVRERESEEKQVFSFGPMINNGSAYEIAFMLHKSHTIA